MAAILALLLTSHRLRVFFWTSALVLEASQVTKRWREGCIDIGDGGLLLRALVNAEVVEIRLAQAGALTHSGPSVVQRLAPIASALSIIPNSGGLTTFAPVFTQPRPVHLFILSIFLHVTIASLPYSFSRHNFVVVDMFPSSLP